MKLSTILALTTLTFSLAASGCAVGSDDEVLPTPQPAHEYSAPLDTTAQPAVQTTEREGLDQAYTLYDTQGNDNKNPYFNALHQVQQPVVNPVPQH